MPLGGPAGLRDRAKVGLAKGVLAYRTTFAIARDPEDEAASLCEG